MAVRSLIVLSKQYLYEWLDESTSDYSQLISYIIE